MKKIIQYRLNIYKKLIFHRQTPKNLLSLFCRKYEKALDKSELVGQNFIRKVKRNKRFTWAAAEAEAQAAGDDEV